MQLPDEEIQQLFDDLEAAAAAFGKAKALRIGKEEARKVTKNELMLVAEANGNHTISKQERFAYSHPTYKQIVKDLVAAVENEAIREYACKIIEMKWETWRSIGANMRAARG